MSENPLKVIKYSTTVSVPRAMLLDMGLIDPTETERAEIVASRTEYDRHRAAGTEAWPLFVAALDAITDPVARAVLDLHRAEIEDIGKGECHGCDVDGYEAEYPYWPCRTVETVAEACGICIDPDLRYAEQYRGPY